MNENTLVVTDFASINVGVEFTWVERRTSIVTGVATTENRDCIKCGLVAGPNGTFYNAYYMMDLGTSAVKCYVNVPDNAEVYVEV